MRLALSSLLSGGAPPDFSRTNNFAPVAGSRSDIDLYLDVESSDLLPEELDELRADLPALMARAAAKPLFRKTHDYWGRVPSGRPLFPPDATLASLYLVRDPRDVAVSYAHFSARDVDSTIAFMAKHNAYVAESTGALQEQARIFLSSWSAHVRSWLAATPTPLLLRYEDMLAEPAHSLTRVAEHFGLPNNPELIDAAVAATRFDALQRQETDKGFSIVRTNEGRRFFRQGRAGGWRDVLSLEQVSRIESAHGDVMRMLGYL